jgi:hypothetical protein
MKKLIKRYRWLLDPAVDLQYPNSPISDQLVLHTINTPKTAASVPLLQPVIQICQLHEAIGCMHSPAQASATI